MAVIARIDSLTAPTGVGRIPKKLLHHLEVSLQSSGSMFALSYHMNIMCVGKRLSLHVSH